MEESVNAPLEEPWHSQAGFLSSGGAAEIGGAAMLARSGDVRVHLSRRRWFKEDGGYTIRSTRAWTSHH